MQDPTNLMMIKAMALSEVSAERIFRDAYDFYEDRKSKKYIVQRFLDYVHQDKIPDVVCDYLLEILTQKVIYRHK